MPVLAPEQIAFFHENGYLLASGLIPQDAVARAEAAFWAEAGADPADRSTWPVGTKAGLTRHPDILACFTREIAAAVDMLSGEPRPDWTPPQGSLAINAYPQPGPWSHPGPHIDHALPQDGYKTFPRPMRLASLLYFNHVEPHSGGTLVWPGSHRTIEALAQTDPEKYGLMAPLNQRVRDGFDLGEGIEVDSKAGDVLFYHYLCGHSGSINVGNYPRFALAHKW